MRFPSDDDFDPPEERDDFDDFDDVADEQAEQDVDERRLPEGVV